MLRKWALRFCFLVVLAILPLVSYAGDPLKVQFAGFAFGGDYATHADRFPYSLQINQQGTVNNVSPLNRIALEQVGKLAINGIVWITDGAGKLDQGPAVAMAIVLNRETVSVEQIGGTHKLVVELAAEALFFDFKEQQVIASFPVVVQLRDVLEAQPDMEAKRDRVLSLYNGSSGVSLFAELATSMRGVVVREKYKYRIGIRDVRIEEAARKILPASISKGGGAEQWLAQSFGSYLVANQHVALVPYTKDYAISNKMAGRFADGRVFSLTLPQPDYAVDLVLKGFKKILYSESVAGKAWVYGVFSDIRVYEQLSQRDYFKGSLKQGATKKVPASQSETDDWPPYQEALLKLYSDFTEQVGVADKDWVKSHTGNTDLVEPIRNLRETMEKCR